MTGLEKLKVLFAGIAGGVAGYAVGTEVAPHVTDILYSAPVPENLPENLWDTVFAIGLGALGGLGTAGAVAQMYEKNDIETAHPTPVPQ